MADLSSAVIAKGYRFEELLRAHFLAQGCFAVRSVPLQSMGDDLTDLDIWFYEAAFDGLRRRQIVDAKFKARPKAIERILWTRGLAEFLELDGAWIATTDNRSLVYDVAKKLRLKVLGGRELQAIFTAFKDLHALRMPEEELMTRVNLVDKNHRDKKIFQIFRDTKFALIDNFGASTLVRALENFAYCASKATEAHPGSKTAEVYVRMSYFAAAIAAIGLDAVTSDVYLRSEEEKRKAIVSSVRYGHTDETSGLEKMRLALGLLRRYGSSDSVAQSVEVSLRRELKSIPAEIIAENSSTLRSERSIFEVSRKFESAAYAWSMLSFDEFGTEEKAFLGTLLDYSGVKRLRFAESWARKPDKDLIGGDLLEREPTPE